MNPVEVKLHLSDPRDFVCLWAALDSQHERLASMSESNRLTLCARCAELRRAMRTLAETVRLMETALDLSE
jgi:hypothetical protein